MLRSLFAIAYLILTLKAKSQTDSLPIFNIEKNGQNYIAFETIRDTIYTVTDDGSLVIWDMTLKDIISISTLSNGNTFTAITKNHHEIWLGSKDGTIYKIGPSSSLAEVIKQGAGPVVALAVNSHGELWIATSEGIYNPVTKQLWDKFYHDTTAGLVYLKVDGSRQRVTEYYNKPQHAFLDFQDRWWLTSFHGEFGGEIELFDTRTKKILDNRFDSLNYGLFFPQSISQLPNNSILISSGIQHFSEFGELISIDSNKTVKRLYKTRKLFIGPSIYNPKDSSFYITSDDGVFKMKMPKDGVSEKLEYLFTPRIISLREPMAIGQAMPIIKVELYNNGLLFLTAKNGIGYYTGKSITYFK